MQCAAIAEDLTALADGELAPERAVTIRDHLSSCGDCSKQLTAIERSLVLQRRSLSELPELRPGFDTRMWARLDEVRAQESRSRWSLWWKPLAIAAGAAAAVLVAAAPLGGPSAVLVPLGIQRPPAKVAKQTDLFRDYQIIEHLDELEHFDTVESEPLDDNSQDKPNGAA